VLRQIVQSAIDKRRLTSAEIQVNDQLNSIGLDVKYPLYRLPQADLFKGEKVITGDDGLKPSSEAENIVQNVQIENTLEGVNCIKVTTETSSTRGQQGGSKIDAYEMKENKGHNDGEALERSCRLGQPTAASVCAVVNFSRYEQL
jgi:hypothetical protein